MLLARPDEEKRSRQTEIGHGPVDPKRINHFEVHLMLDLNKFLGYLPHAHWAPLD